VLGALRPRRGQGARSVGDDEQMLVIDAANVVGSRPNGWWRDRGKAAADLCAALATAVDAGRVKAPVVVILEGAARQGVSEDELGGVRIVHAPGHGDDTIAGLVADAAASGQVVTAVTADRELRSQIQRSGADVVGPNWLLDRL
jgi:hypothetical protein